MIVHVKDRLGFQLGDFRCWLVALALLAGSSSEAFAGLQLCNEYNHTVHYAIAFQTPQGWVSEGWFSAEPKGCTDTKYENLNEFYWTAKTDWYGVGGGKRQQTTWGKGRKFSVKSKSFSLTNADRQIRGARYVAFSGPVTVKGPTAVMVEIEADASSVVVTTPLNTLSADPDYKTCETASGDDAIAACDRAIASGKFSGHLLAALHLNRGVERKRKHDFDGAMSDYNAAIGTDDKFALAYRNRGWIHFDQGDIDDAIKDFDQAIQLDPNGYEGYVARGDAHRKKGEMDLAAADYTKALSLNPPDKDKQDIQSSLQRASLGGDSDFKTCEKSSGDEAIAACDRAIDSGKFSGHMLAALHVNRGVERKRKDDLDGAVSDYSEAIGIDNKFVLAYQNRGRAQYSKGNYGYAIDDFSKAIELDPDTASNYSDRGDAYRKKSDREQAKADYKKALSLNPDADTKQAIEASLYELSSAGTAETPAPAPPDTSGP